MPDTVIEIEHLFKEYRLGLIGYGTLREDLQSWWAKARGKEDPNSMLFSENQSRDGKAPDHILALNDINLEVKQGERLGIIGNNGAGKTTLLKILSRIASPTKGKARIKGRVASLIAVGTGFHGELTGRENIYLNGSILGLRKFEIDRRFDEIVDFSGVEQFIDTPVKRYSSGMYVRLGFAVAAHLDPDVLIVDEVLAVGDAEFRKKALGKMKDVSKGGGRTVLFVSHNMESIRALCDRAVLFQSGKLVLDGPTNEVVDSYLSAASDEAEKFFGERIWNMDNAPGNDVVRLLGICSKNEKGEKVSTFDVSEEVFIEIEFIVLKEGYQFYQCLEFNNMSKVYLFRIYDDYVNKPWGKQKPLDLGRRKTTYCIPKNFFQDGVISINVNISTPEFAFNFANPIREIEVFSLKIIDSLMTNDSTRGSYPYSRPGGEPVLRPLIKSITEDLPK